MADEEVQQSGHGELERREVMHTRTSGNGSKGNEDRGFFENHFLEQDKERSPRRFH
jgi:hypothetical protein